MNRIALPANLSLRQFVRHLMRYFSGSQNIGILLLIFVFMGLQFFMLDRPYSLLGDEIYYVPEAKSILNHNGLLHPEHPPLGKLFITLGIRLFGDTPFGWRFFPVLFSSISILCLYLTCLRLNLPRWAGLAVAFLFAFENLSFLTGSMATLDVFMLTFMLAALLAFLDRKLVLAGLLAGLAALAKLPGVFVLGVFFLYWLVLERENWRLIIIPVFTSGITFLGLMTLLDFVVAGVWQNPLITVQNMLSFAATLSSDEVFGISINSEPWEWLVNRGVIFYSYSPQRIALVSYTVLCLVIPAVIYSIRGSFKKEKQAVIALAWFACTYLSWLVVSLIFHRLMYIWYFYPVVPGICLALGYGMQRFTGMAQDAGNHRLLISVKTGVLLYLLVHLVLFILLSPVGIPLVKWVYTG